MSKNTYIKVNPVILFIALMIGSPLTGADSLALSAAAIDSQPNPAYSALEPDIDMLGRWYGGPVYSSVVSGKYVYFGTGGGIRVLKIKKSGKQDAPAWQEVASIKSFGVVRDLDVSGKFLYVADDSGAMRIIDISKPEKPRERGHVELPDFVRAISIEGQYAYLAAGWAGLTVIDISDPDQPRHVQSLKSVGYITDVHVSNSLALVVGHKAGLKVVDASNPSQPLVIGHYEMRGNPHGVYALNQHAYVVSLDTAEGDNSGGLTIFDISDPTAPELEGFQQLIYGAARVWVEGKYAYLAAGANESGLIIVDVLNSFMEYKS